MNDKSKGDLFLGNTPSPGKPKGLVDALSEIQQFYVVERTGSPIPPDFFTIGAKLAFFEVGFKAAFLSGLVSAVLTPFAMGVLEKYIPIFGSTSPSLFDKIFALVLAVSFSIGYAVFISFVGNYYIGSLPRLAIRNLLGGFFTGAILKMIIVFLIFHTLYFFILTPAFLQKNLLKLTTFIKYDTLNKIYQFLLEFKPVFLTSSYFVILTTVLMLCIPIASILFGSRRTQKQIFQEEKWGG